MDRESFLQTQIAKGQRANKAYESYIKEIIEEYKMGILRDFMNTESNPTMLLSLKSKLDFLLELERMIKADIDNANMAAKELGINP